MKKLITILFLFSFVLNAQVKRTFQASESFVFTPDKGLHVKVASGITAGTYTFLYCKSKDAGLAFRGAIIFPTLLCVGKEVADRHFNIADLGYGVGSVVVTTFISHGINKWIEKRRKKTIKRIYKNEY